VAAGGRLGQGAVCNTSAVDTVAARPVLGFHGRRSVTMCRNVFFLCFVGCLTQYCELIDGMDM
jgi:hypothetical protein